MPHSLMGVLHKVCVNGPHCDEMEGIFERAFTRWVEGDLLRYTARTVMDDKRRGGLNTLCEWALGDCFRVVEHLILGTVGGSGMFPTEACRWLLDRNATARKLACEEYDLVLTDLGVLETAAERREDPCPALQAAVMIVEETGYAMGLRRPERPVCLEWGCAWLQCPLNGETGEKTELLRCTGCRRVGSVYCLLRATQPDSDDPTTENVLFVQVPFEVSVLCQRGIRCGLIEILGSDWKDGGHRERCGTMV